MAFFTNSSMIGVDLNTPSSTQNFSLGSVVGGSDGSLWQYVVASTTVSAYSVVVVNQSGTMQMAVLGNVNAGQGNYLAVAQSAFAPSEYGWVPVHGGTGEASMSVKVSGSATLGTTLYMATSSGNISTTAAASATLKGIALVTATEAWVGATAQAVIISWPRVNTNGA